MTPEEAGQQFLEQVLAHVPDDQRDAARAALLASKEALQEVGNGVLRQSDYSRNMNAVSEYKSQLDTWFEENKALITRAATTPASPAVTPPAEPNANFLTRDDMVKELQTREQAAIAAIVTTNELGARHYAAFQEPLDIRGLMADPDISKLGLQGVYDKVHGSRHAERAKQAEQARIDKLVNEKLAEERKRFTAHPYPVTGRESSALDAIEAAIANPA